MSPVGLSRPDYHRRCGCSRRSAAPWQCGKDTESKLFEAPETDARTVAVIEPGAIGRISQCNGEMSFDGHTGWLGQALVWGARIPARRSRISGRGDFGRGGVDG
jgi:SH3-like domain-containing protein